MRERTTALGVALGLALAGMACGGAETGVVNQYFTALNAGDTNTLTSFASVTFEQKVDSWKIVGVSEEMRGATSLPDLVATQAELEAALAENKKAARTWGNDLEIYPKLDRVRELQKDEKAIPKSLQPIAEKWDEFNEKDKELKAQVAEAKQAVAQERQNTQLSVGQVEGVETLPGEVVSKTVDVDLTIEGQVKPYVMGLRKYELDSESAGPRMVSRWVVQSLEPRS